MIPIDKQTSEALAAKVVSFRVLKMNKDGAKEAMIELAKRKANGDDFDYDSYIEEKIKSIPLPTVGDEQKDNLKKTMARIKNGNI